MSNDLEFVKKLLPQYDCTEEKQGAIRCKSYIGIDNDKAWNRFKNTIIEHFIMRFQEIYHETNYNHKDFFVYYKPH